MKLYANLSNKDKQIEIEIEIQKLKEGNDEMGVSIEMLGRKYIMLEIWPARRKSMYDGLWGCKWGSMRRN